MSWKSICHCDNCGMQKKDANGWLCSAVGQRIPTEHWTMEIASLPGAISVCGPACAHKLLDMILSDKHNFAGAG